MYATHTLAEWFAFLLLSGSGYAAMSVPYFLLVDSDSARDFDPRPAVARLLESGRLDLLLIAVADAKYDVREAVHASRKAGRDLAALLTTSPKGQLR